MKPTYGVRCANDRDRPMPRETLEEARRWADECDYSSSCGPHVVFVSRDGGETWEQVARA